MVETSIRGIGSDVVYKVLARRVVCSNKRFDVLFDTIKEPSGHVIDDFLVVRPHVRDAQCVAGVCVIPEVGGAVGLMRGFRHQLNMSVWQAPSGFIERGERPEVTALRELEEETGLTCNLHDLKALGTFLPDAGLIEGRVALYLARNARRSAVPGSPEVGTGPLQFFSGSQLAHLAIAETNVGGSTLVACLRYLLGVADQQGRADED